jgi:hypothetical protein
LLTFALLALACNREPPTDNHAPRGPDDLRVVRNHFEQIVEVAKGGDADKVRAELVRYLALEPEVLKLFGAEVGPRVWAGYGAMQTAFLAEAPQLIVDRVKEGYTEVFGAYVGPAAPEHTTPGDRAMLDAFVSKGLMGSIWLRPPGEKLGLRFNGFVYRGGHWRALLKSYDWLKPREE